MIGTLPAPHGGLTIIKHQIEPHIQAARDGRLIRDDENGHYWADRANLVYEKKNWGEAWQAKMLAWLRDNIHPEIPRAYYKAVLGHDLHVSQYAELFTKHFHTSQRDPFTGRDTGWLENVGRVSVGKVTAAFINFEALMLVTDATTIGDFKYHETGTSNQAEANTDTALITTAISGSLAARVAGNQTNPTAPTYQTVATLTATGTATWQEHGVFNASSGVTLMDRSLISPTASVVNLDTVTFTYVLTKTPEA